MKTILSSRRYYYAARFCIFLITVALIAGMVGCGQPTPPEEGVVFVDPDLEAAVREAITIPEGPIYPSDLDSLTYLGAWTADIDELTGLESCTSLTELYLGGNRMISEISHLWPTSPAWQSSGFGITR